MDPLEASDNIFENEIYGLKMAMFNYDMVTFELLWDIQYRWQFEHLMCILDFILADLKKYKNFVKLFVRTETFKEITTDLTSKQAEKMAAKYLDILKKNHSSNTKDSKEIIVAVLDILHHANSLPMYILVKALDTLDPHSKEITVLYNNVFKHITPEIVRSYRPLNYKN